MNNIKKFIKQFTDAEISGIQKIGRRYFLVAEEQAKIAGNLKLDIFSIGLFIGEMKHEFMPTPALLDIISKTSSRKAYINKKSEWLFLCGRDVFDQSIDKCSAENGLVLVQNDKDENLGYGEVRTKGKSKFIKNLLDRGDYLRRED